MTMQATEQEITQTVEAAEHALSSGDENGSEGTAETTAAPEKPDVKAVEKPDPEFEKWKADKRAQSWLQGEADKRSKSYQEKREADTALIRRLNDELRTAKQGTTQKKMASLMERITNEAGDEGLSDEQTKPLMDAIKEFAENYDKNYSAVEESRTVIKSVTELLPARAVSEYGLDDANPVIQAKNWHTFAKETAATFDYNEKLLLAMEAFLPKGDEVRKQLEELLEGMTDSDYPTEKSRKEYLSNRMKGLKTTSRRAPPAPSNIGGSKSFKDMTPEEKLAEGKRREANNPMKIGGK